MASLLDSIVPSRCREKRRLLALEERLNARWGDPSITAPTDGGWNSFHSDREGYEEPTRPFALLSPVEESHQDSLESPAENDIVTKEQTPHEQPNEPERQQATLTVTIPLPWKKSHTRGHSSGHEASQPKDSVTSPVTRSLTTSPTVVLYKPASEEYRKELDRSLGSQTTSPAVIYKPVSEEYKKALDGFSLNRPLTPAPYEQRFGQDGHQRHESTSTPMSHPDTDGVNSDSNDTTSVTSSRHTSDTIASTPSTDHTIPDELVKRMGDLGLCPSPSLRQGVRDLRSESLGAVRGNIYRESVSSSSSGDSAGGGLASPRGLHLMTMSSGNGYYASLAQEYKQIAKTVEEDLAMEYKKKSIAKPISQQQYSDGSQTRGTLSSERSMPSVAQHRRATSHERRRDKSVERRKQQPEMIMAGDRLQHTGRQKGRAQSVDRYPLYSKDRPAILLKDRHRGVSVERPRRRADSTERCGPQELVPKADEIWG